MLFRGEKDALPKQVGTVYKEAVIDRKMVHSKRRREQ